MKPLISLIVAKSQNNVIGNKGKLPWHFPEDLKFFKQVTMGRPILMGRTTWESIGRPLPGRRNIVLTRDPNYVAEGAEVVHSFEEALELEDYPEGLFVIGGSKLYASSLPYVDIAWITEIMHDFEGDSFFPELNPQEWKRVWVEEHEAGENRPWPFRFQRFDRIANKCERKADVKVNKEDLSMTKETMSIQIDSKLKKEFLDCVNFAYKGKTEEGIIDLMRIYVERAKSTPGQKSIRATVKENVFVGDRGSALSSREIEKIMLNKTDEQIESARLDKINKAK